MFFKPHSWLTTILLLPLLTACTPSYMVKMNSIREALLPTVQREMADARIEPGAPGFIRIFKEESVLEFWLQRPDTEEYQLYKTFPVCSYSGLLGPKLFEGDMQAPEGFYAVTEEHLWPGSKHHLAMNIGYPNEYDRSNRRTGSHIMVHGGCESEGCFAMTDEGIEEIYLLAEQSLQNGQSAVPVHIFPFRMTDANLERHGSAGWLPFWSTLKQGYDAFERSQIPPIVTVQNHRYAFDTLRLVRRGDY